MLDDESFRAESCSDQKNNTEELPKRAYTSERFSPQQMTNGIKLVKKQFRTLRRRTA